MTNQVAINLIKESEELILTAYKDPCSANGLPITVGWGTTNDVLPPGESFKLGDKIDEATAERWLMYFIDNHIVPEIDKMVNYELNENEYAAILDFCYNLGTECLDRSTMLKMINSNDFSDAQLEFLKFNEAGGHIVRGLLCRRLKEAVLFGPLTREQLIAQYLNGVDPEVT